MKRTIAIALTVLSLVFCLTACGQRNDGNVTQRTDGMVSDRNTSETRRNMEQNTDSAKQSDRANDQDFTTDGAAGDILDKAGNAIENAGDTVGGMVSGNNAGTGMTGSR